MKCHETVLLRDFDRAQTQHRAGHPRSFTWQHVNPADDVIIDVRRQSRGCVDVAR